MSEFFELLPRGFSVLHDKEEGTTEINLALSDNVAPELTLMEGTGIGTLGMTAYAAREMILGEDFPQELKSYGLTMLTMLGARADQYAQEGKLGGDAGLPNLERLLQTDEESREQLDAIYAARDELTRNMQDARREHEEESAKSPVLRRAAFDGAGERAGGRLEGNHRRPDARTDGRAGGVHRRGILRPGRRV